MTNKTIRFFDIESTGTDISKDRIIQLSLIKTDLNFSILDKKKLLLSNCGVPIHPDAFKAHGISEESILKHYKELTKVPSLYQTISDCPGFSAYAHRIHEYIQDCDFLGGYNIKGFDIPLLYEEFARAGIEWKPKPAFDAFRIFSNREKRNLTAAVKFYCGREMIDGAHDSEIDVLETIEVLKNQVRHYSFDSYLHLIKEEDEHAKEGFQPLEQVLVSESSFPDEDKRLTFDGKLILNEQGEAIINFGKDKGKLVSELDLGYINWILTSDFSSNTKNVLRCLINKK